MVALREEAFEIDPMIIFVLYCYAPKVASEIAEPHRREGLEDGWEHVEDAGWDGWKSAVGLPAVRQQERQGGTVVHAEWPQKERGAANGASIARLPPEDASNSAVTSAHGYCAQRQVQSEVATDAALVADTRKVHTNNQGVPERVSHGQSVTPVGRQQKWSRNIYERNHQDHREHPTFTSAASREGQHRAG